MIFRLFVAICINLHGISGSSGQADKQTGTAIVPDFIPSVPEGLVYVNFGGLDIKPGIEVTPTQVRNEPTVNWYDADPHEYYTLIMTDIDADPKIKFKEFQHWTVANIPGKNIAKGNHNTNSNAGITTKNDGQQNNGQSPWFTLGLVPNFIRSPPKSTLKIDFDGSPVLLGNVFTPTQVKNMPSLHWDADSKAFYTLIMMDVDGVGMKDKRIQFLHWLVGNIPGYDIAKGETLAQFVSSGPAKGSGLHRYVFLVFRQRRFEWFEDFTQLGNTSADGRNILTIEKIAERYQFTELTAGNFYRAEYDEFAVVVRTMLGLSLKVNKQKRAGRVYFDVEKLKDPGIAEQFRIELAGKFAPLLLLDQNQDSQTLCDEFTKTMIEVAEKKIGKARKVKKEWLTSEILENCDERRDKKGRKNLSAEDLEQYRIVNRKTRNLLNKTKNEWIEKQTKEIEDNMNLHNSKKAYEIVTKLCRTNMDNTKRRQASVIEDKDGNLLTKSEGSKVDESVKSEKEIRMRIGRATSALAKLENTWRAKNIAMKNKILLMRAIVESTLLYACESWTSVMDTMKRRKFKYFGHMVREGGMARAILEGGVEGSRGRGRPMGNWLGNLKEWSGQAASVLTRRAEDRVLWRKSVRAWVHLLLRAYLPPHGPLAGVVASHIDMLELVRKKSVKFKASNFSNFLKMAQSVEFAKKIFCNPFSFGIATGIFDRYLYVLLSAIGYGVAAVTTNKMGDLKTSVLVIYLLSSQSVFNWATLLIFKENVSTYSLKFYSYVFAAALFFYIAQYVFNKGLRAGNPAHLIIVRVIGTAIVVAVLVIFNLTVEKIIEFVTYLLKIPESLWLHSRMGKLHTVTSPFSDDFVNMSNQRRLPGLDTFGSRDDLAGRRGLSGSSKPT
ncbi:Phosphatidylethanolamine-binding F40A3.3 [Nymphon striatum]|nr:Phosphatidylethanolamine-binding F40A3.3 [Nymphon striatum]